jgi:galactose mutarotase-like enzyme
MFMFILENEDLRIRIVTKGAEMQSIYNKKNGLEYLWKGDPAIWGKHSPVLFPIVGTLKNDAYFFEGASYTLGRHGFARDRDFIPAAQTNDAITLRLISSEATRPVFPFSFEFDITYAIRNNKLIVTYGVTNSGEQPMFFSVGGHPAFKVPLEEKSKYEDYYLEFEKEENAGRWPISPEGLIEKNLIPLLDHTTILPVTKELFSRDALVFKHLQSSRVKLRSHTSDAGLEMDFTGFPYLGIWAAKGADFLCIEPWCGIADSTDSNQELTEKEGIISLKAGGVFERSWSVGLF